MNPENNNFESNINPEQPTAPVQPQPMPAQPTAPVQPQSMPAQPVSKKKSHKVLITVLAIIGGIVVFAVAIIFIVSAVSRKMVCTSPEGDITLMYNSKKIVGYTAKNITYDLEGQQKIAEKIGVEEYLKEFDDWFGANTSGSCKR